ncbi:WYL domain-containing protein [Pontibacter chitinilyticus]|uniref:WYL domain-containing protein n=1 Tax=Pontibacter chitinilyticus TaxID=2674989 RepID=UPI00321AA190
MYSYLLEDLSKAIGARLLIQFDYQGKKYRVEPHLLGHNHAHQDCLCAWKVEGTTNTKDEWHCFLLTDILNLQLLEDRFTKKRPGYDPYNSSMARVYYRI